MPKEKLTVASYMLTPEQKDWLAQLGAKDDRSASYALRQIIDEVKAAYRAKEEGSYVQPATQHA